MNPLLWSVSARVPVKLFFAIRPDTEAGAAIEKLGATLKAAHRLRGRAIARQRLHNTLAGVHHPGTIGENLARAKDVGDRLGGRRFSVCFDWTGSFKNGGHNHPLVLRGEEGLDALAEFRESLRVQMARAGFLVERNFTPHVTLLWADRGVDDYPIAPISWTAREFVLTASLQGYSHHIDVARWPLR